MTTRRLDQLLVERGLFPSRQQARGAILAGIVFVDGRRIDKAGTAVPTAAGVEIRGETLPYVSRGGLKLKAALDRFRVDPSGWIALDAGASTGGFTDCLLQAGAAKVYAVDVGYGQLDWSLRNDERVVVMERTNARHLTKEHVPEELDLVVGDVSFIGLGKLFPALAPLLKDGGKLLVLVKPQFEAGRRRVGKGGVVKDAAVHRDVLREVAGQAAEQRLQPRDVMPSPVTGPRGNVEYLLLADKVAAAAVPGDWSERVREAVEEAAPLRGDPGQELTGDARNCPSKSGDDPDEERDG